MALRRLGRTIPLLWGAAATPSPPPGASGLSSPSAEAESAAPDTSQARAGRTGGRWLYVGIVVVVAVVLFAAILALGMRAGTKSTQSTVLIPADTLTTISVGQYAGVEFVASSAGVVNGTYSDQYGVVFYLMTDPEYEHLVSTLNVSGYIWTLNVSSYVNQAYLSIDVDPGEWWFAMANPNATVATAVGWQSPLTFSPT